MVLILCLPLISSNCRMMDTQPSKRNAIRKWMKFVRTLLSTGFVCFTNTAHNLGLIFIWFKIIRADWGPSVTMAKQSDWSEYIYLLTHTHTYIYISTPTSFNKLYTWVQTEPPGTNLALTFKYSFLSVQQHTCSMLTVRIQLSWSRCQLLELQTDMNILKWRVLSSGI
jgi:hypothetical protein